MEPIAYASALERQMALALINERITTYHAKPDPLPVHAVLSPRHQVVTDVIKAQDDGERFTATVYLERIREDGTVNLFEDRRELLFEYALGVDAWGEIVMIHRCAPVLSTWSSGYFMPADVDRLWEAAE